MRYTNTTQQGLYEFVRQNKNLIDSIELIKATDPYGFNDMEGYHSELRFKIITIDGYKNKYVSITTNSSYLEDDYPTFEEYGDLVAESLNNDLM